MNTQTYMRANEHENPKKWSFKPLHASQ